jgi:hypothetical protein
MGGGRLLATFNAGPIYASFEAWASFLVNFKPFFFLAEIGINVTVGCSISLGLIHINIHAEIGADLSLQGPPFGGVAHVHFWFIGFSVEFGDLHNTPPPLSWDDFVSVVREPGPSSQGQAGLVVIAIEAGSANEKTDTADQKPGTVWHVKAGQFKFRVECKFPLSTMNYGDR